MKTKTSFYLFSFLVLGMCLMLTESCDKDDEPVPILTTSDVTEITPVSAKCGGHITSYGGATVIERGVCWSTGLTPFYKYNQWINRRYNLLCKVVCNQC